MWSHRPISAHLIGLLYHYISKELDERLGLSNLAATFIVNWRDNMDRLKWIARSHFSNSCDRI